MGLPLHFCWSRFGTEAGESIESILLRKESERVANGGIFLWGIGNAVAPSMKQLLCIEPNPIVIFSPIRSVPHRSDVTPEEITVWTSGRTLEGWPYRVPIGCMVTSRSKAQVNRNRHYALVCASSSKLCINPAGEQIQLGRLRNLLSNRPIGSSQVTAIVRQTVTIEQYSNVLYPAAIKAELVFPYFVELTDGASRWCAA